MTDVAEAAVTMFESVHENPELIWNDSAREKVSKIVDNMLKKHYRSQRENAEFKWSLPEDYAVVYAQENGEFMIGGVFLRIFISNPGWVLRKPREFLTGLLEKWSDLVKNSNSNNDSLELVTTALLSLLTAQPMQLDIVPQLGVLPQFFNAMQSKHNSSVMKYSITIVNKLSTSAACVQAISQIDSCIQAIKHGMSKRPDTIGVACECFHNLFHSVHEQLVEQALASETIPFLIKLLDSKLEQCENPSATKAQIVNALKAMETSLKYGEKITGMLDGFPIWKQFRDQKHDLFITDKPAMGYLTGPTNVGYLTSGRSNNIPDKPPPI